MPSYANRRIQEIVARTVIARGDRRIAERCVLQPAEKPEQLLGVTCVPGATKASRQDGNVAVTGDFEIHLWYAHSGSQRTTVLKQTFTYDDIVPVSQLAGEPVGEPQVTVALTQNPHVVSCQLAADGRFHVEVALAVQAELTGDARLRVQVFLPGEEAVDVVENFDLDDDFDPVTLPNGHAAVVNDVVAADFD